MASESASAGHERSTSPCSTVRPAHAFFSELHPLEWLRRAANSSMPQPIECEQRAGARATSLLPARAAFAAMTTQPAPTGDVLFVPRLWAHGTINIGETVGVAAPFRLRDDVDYGAAAQYGDAEYIQIVSGGGGLW